MRRIALACLMVLCAHAASAQSPTPPPAAIPTSPIVTGAAHAGPAAPAPLATLERVALAAPLWTDRAPGAAEARGRIGAVAGIGLGLLAGTAVGMLYGMIGHPGLPHLGDIPEQFEYAPLFAVAGAITGAVLADR